VDETENEIQEKTPAENKTLFDIANTVDRQAIELEQINAVIIAAREPFEHEGEKHLSNTERNHVASLLVVADSAIDRIVGALDNLTAELLTAHRQMKNIKEYSKKYSRYFFDTILRNYATLNSISIIQVPSAAP
jgi:hypothetical protein